MKKTSKMMGAATIVITAAIILILGINWFLNRSADPMYEGLRYENNGFVLRATAKAQEVLMSSQDDNYNRAVSYARNIRVDLFGENGDILASNLVTGNGHVSVSENAAEYIENDVVLHIDNLGVGTVNVSVSFQGQMVAVSFTATTDGGNGADRLNIVDIHSYALPEAERNVMDVEKGYHENILDAEGNIVGNVDRENITGTTEADEKISNDDRVEIQHTSEGDRIHSEATNKPEVETIPVPTPETKKEEVIEKAPVATPTPTPEATEIPEPTQEPATEPAEKVEEVTEPVATPEPTPIPTPTPVVEMNQAADQEITQKEAEETGLELSSQYARIFILTGTETITIFGNGTENLIIEGSLEMTDLGNGFVSTPYGVFAR